MKTDFNSRLQILNEEHRKLLERKNERINPGNGIFHRYKYPVLTGEHALLFWKCPYHNARMCLEIIEREPNKL